MKSVALSLPTMMTQNLHHIIFFHSDMKLYDITLTVIYLG